MRLANEVEDLRVALRGVNAQPPGTYRTSVPFASSNVFQA
jgi:hypothetical protein